MHSKKLKKQTLKFKINGYKSFNLYKKDFLQRYIRNRSHTNGYRTLNGLGLKKLTRSDALAWINLRKKKSKWLRKLKLKYQKFSRKEVTEIRSSPQGSEEVNLRYAAWKETGTPAEREEYINTTVLTIIYDIFHGEGAHKKLMRFLKNYKIPKISRINSSPLDSGTLGSSKSLCDNRHSSGHNSLGSTLDSNGCSPSPCFSQKCQDSSKSPCQDNDNDCSPKTKEAVKEMTIDDDNSSDDLDILIISVEQDEIDELLERSRVFGKQS